MRAFFVVGVALAASSALLGCPSTPPQQGPIEVLLDNPPDGGTVTWANWAGEFTQDYCVTCHNPSANCGGSGCHATGDPVLFDLREQAAFVAHASVIRCGIAVTQDPSWSCGGTGTEVFPKLATSGNNPFPTDDQRDIMVSWINAGCP